MAEKQRAFRDVHEAQPHIWIVDEDGHPRKIPTEANTNAGVVRKDDGEFVVRAGKKRKGWQYLEAYVREQDGEEGLAKLATWVAYHDRRAFKAGDALSEADIPPCLIPVTATKEKLAKRPPRNTRKAMAEAMGRLAEREARLEAKEARIDAALARIEAMQAPDESKAKKGKGGSGTQPAA